MVAGGGGGGRRKTPRTAAGRRRAESRRLRRMLEAEAAWWSVGVEHVAGIDEAGRGPLAGPVVAAAVILPPHVGIRGVDDSKRLTPSVRQALFVDIQARALAIGVGAASRREIDQINILRATHLAMARALRNLGMTPGHVFVDGLPVPQLGVHTAVVDGDAKVHSVACASVVAKVVRDRLMARLAARYPAYGWDHNAGYGTAEHRCAILEVGLTPHHRRSFAPNQQFTLELPG